MKEEKDICDDNERKTTGDEKEAEKPFQIQKQREIETHRSVSSYPKTNISKFEKISPDLKRIHAHPSKGSYHTFRPFAKVGGSFRFSSSMSRGCLSLSGIWPVVGVVALLAAWVGGSEFPERECCDPVYPPNTATTAAAPITPPIPKLADSGLFCV
ncbi:hypothetical protein B5X24_HaOG214802 [Helicoverpa armigera]|nr:hypothetical protein B5X24_HaOG214802 [Helicoverpa armigera]